MDGYRVVFESELVAVIGTLVLIDKGHSLYTNE